MVGRTPLAVAYRYGLLRARVREPPLGEAACAHILFVRSRPPAPDTVRRIREPRCALSAACCLWSVACCKLRVACCLSRVVCRLFALSGVCCVACCSGHRPPKDRAVPCDSMRQCSSAARSYSSRCVLRDSSSTTTAYSRLFGYYSLLTPSRAHATALPKGGAGVTCILLDGLEVDVLEVLVHLKQRTAATHAE